MTTTIAIKITIRLQFDSSKWASWLYVNEGMNSYQTIFHFGSVWKGYTNVDNWRMLPDVHLSAWMPFLLLPWRTLLRHYMLRPLPSCYDAYRRDEKMNMFNFRRSRIEAESKSNRNCNSRFSSQETYQNYSTQLPVHFPPRNKKCKSVEGKDQRKQHHLLLEITAAMATTKLLVITLQHNRSSLQVNRASAAKWHGNKRATNKYIIYIT